MRLSSLDLTRLRQQSQPAQRDESRLARALQPWWTLAASWVPDSISPNTLTILGTLAVLLPTLVLVTLFPSLEGPIPRWLLVLEALGVFAFQTLDAMDGKHARRTGQSSALGSWLDHSLDILSVQIMLLGAAGTVSVGRGWLLWFLLGSVVVNSWVIHWETHVTRVLVLGDGTSITEAQGLAMAVHVIGAVFGTRVFTTQIFGVGVNALIVLVGVGAVGGAAIVASVRRVLAASRRDELPLLVVRALPPFVVIVPVSVAVALASSATETLIVSTFGSLLGVSLVADLVFGNLVGRFPGVKSRLVRGLVGSVLLVGCALAKLDALGTAVAGVLASIEALLLVAKLVKSSRVLASALGVTMFGGSVASGEVRLVK